MAGRAGSRLAARMGLLACRDSLLRLIHALPEPEVAAVTVLSVDDFALRRRHRYGTVLIDAITHRRIDVLLDRKSATLEAWLQDHPGVKVVVRGGSTTYAEAVRRALPEAVQASDRSHLWHGLAGAVEKAVAAHSRCWAAAGPKRQALTRENTTLERWRAVHNLVDQGVGLLDCSRRLGLALNTVKRYARTPEPDRLRRPPQYRASLVDPYRDHLRQRRAVEPGVPVTSLFNEITTLGYTGSLNLLHKYLNQGRERGDRIIPSPRRLTSWIMSFRISPDQSTVHVDAGMRLAELATRLHRAGLALHTMPSLPHITIAGACSTATHGSGDAVPTLASAVRALTMVSTEGDLITYRRGERDFNGAVVSLGALGVITDLELEVLPTFDVEQYVFEGLPWTRLCNDVQKVLASAYSVSVFLDGYGANLIWAKQRFGDPAVDLSWTGSHPSLQPRHPVPGMPANNCTVQGGVPGPWYERLPHFKLEFAPSVGAEVQSEYLVDRRSAASALRSLGEIIPHIAPLLHSMEVRSVKEDSFWLSPCFGQPSMALHFTWIPDADRVRSAVAAVEERLSVHGARPHWAKLFGIDPDRIAHLYSHRDSFCRLRREMDPEAKFGNDMIDRFLPM